jgi:NhaA family Na+:H+ antiporter
MTTITTEKKRLRIDEAFGNLIKSNTLGGLLLIIFTIISLVWANSPWKDSYHQIWHTNLSFQLGSFKFEMHLLHWINDLFMAVFFYLVGLEIKREIFSGELSSPKKAALPALGALGGMVIPAVLYIAIVSFSANDEAIKG